MDYQPRTNIVKDEKRRVTDLRCIFARWRNHFSHLLNVHGVGDVRQKELHVAEPLVLKPNVSEVEMAIEELKRHKSQHNWLKLGVGQFILRSINSSTLLRIKRYFLRCGRSRSLYLFIRRVITQIVVIIEAYHICQLNTKFYPASCCQV